MSVGMLAAPEIPETVWQDGLPPEEFWAIPPIKKEPTPTDDRGFIIVDDLVTIVKRYIRPEYSWPNMRDIHHLYYYAGEYQQVEQESGGAIPSLRFRELAINKLLVPRYFHNVLHLVTERAPMPDPEVMRYRIDAWDCAVNLFTSVRSATQTERMQRRLAERPADINSDEQKKVNDEYMNEQFLRHFRGVGQHLGALTLIPIEYWPFSPAMSARVAAGHVGDIVLHGRQRQMRSVLLPNSN
jgi:hypothetical protein